MFVNWLFAVFTDDLVVRSMTQRTARPISDTFGGFFREHAETRTGSHAMKRRFLAALSALLVGHGLAFAQQVGSNPDPIVREPLWISTVARAGEQIDPVINVSQFPIRSGDGPLAGRARPAPKFHGTDFWAQGLNFGLELRY